VCRSGSNAITAPAVTGPSPGTLHKRRISTFSRVASLGPNVGSLIFAVRDRSDRGRAGHDLPYGVGNLGRPLLQQAAACLRWMALAERPSQTRPSGHAALISGVRCRTTHWSVRHGTVGALYRNTPSGHSSAS
jgi:hypothetical protein